MPKSYALPGSCHCGNLSFLYRSPLPLEAVQARACGCSFCLGHGARYTSHPQAKLRAKIADSSDLSRYRFGTATAEFYVCRRCGVVPFITSEVEGRLYAVVNVNTLHGFDASTVSTVTADFEGESVDERLGRRHRNWIGTVEIVAA